MRDSIVPRTAEVVQDIQKQQDTIPDPSDIKGTLKYWDDYRARERKRFGALNLKLDENGVPLPGQAGLAAAFTIGEMPTTENLVKIEAAEKAHERALKMAEAEAARQENTPWRKAKRWLRRVFLGTLNPSASSGAASARRTPGTGTTE